jgi:flagellar biosynthetic protein FliR
MSTAAVQQLLNGIGTSHVIAFFLVLARVSPLFMIAPLFSSSVVPSQVRVIAAVAITIGLVGVAAHGQQLPSAPLPLFGLVLEQLLVGGAIAFAIGALFAAVQAAGTLLDGVAGFSFGAMLNPLTGTQAAILAQTYGMVGTMIFIALGGEGWVLEGLGRTFTLVPLSGSVQVDGIVAGSVAIFSTIFTSALEVAAPVVLAVTVTDIAFGMVSRVVPQLNVYAVGFPVKVAVALLTVTASLPFLGGWLGGQLGSTVGNALRELVPV